MKAEQSTLPVVAVVGVGLIGGSLAAALKMRRLASRVVGIGRDPARLESAARAELIDGWATDARDVAAEADFVVFATPVDRIISGVHDVGPLCRDGAILTDVGSVKQVICESISHERLNNAVFIGSHPIAGSEKRGFEHADADLFEDRVCVVTPDDSTPPNMTAALCRFWQSVGCRVYTMTPAEHDQRLAETSHVPHLVASAVAQLLDDQGVPLTGTGFRDTTRIAAGDPDVWVGILEQNASNIVPQIDRVLGQLEAFRGVLTSEDSDGLRRLLAEAKMKRERLDVSDLDSAPTR